MHPKREKRIIRELKNASARSLTIKFEIKRGDGAIVNTLEFREMPALVFKSGGKQILKCLPFNQLGVGATEEEAEEVLRDDLNEIFTDILDESGLLKLVDGMLQGTAAGIYWKRYIGLVEEAIQAEKKGKEAEQLTGSVELKTEPPTRRSVTAYPEPESIAAPA